MTTTPRALVDLIAGSAAGPDGYVRLAVDAPTWEALAAGCAAGAHDLAALWADGDCMHMALSDGERGLRAVVFLKTGAGAYPSVGRHHAPALRLERAMRDLYGTHPIGLPDTRPWLDHGRWPGRETEQRYEFLPVEGEGLHQIPVGPVHAGIIEPGHFRFTANGETVVRLEERLGYVHKGIERRFTDFALADGYRLAARVSGDSTVAFAWAYCQAAEAIADVRVPPRATWLRALYLEVERIQNHLGDLGALGNDAGFAFGLAQFSRLKEELLRSVEATLGRRYLFDAVVPGGTARDLLPEAATALALTVAAVAAAATGLRAIYEAHTGVRDRFVGAGAVAPELAQRLGLTGFAGRASGQRFDVRTDLASAPYDRLDVRSAISEAGDVAARVAVRFDELAESCRLVGTLLAGLPDGAHATPYTIPPPGLLGLGLVEGWRGPVFVALESGARGGIHRCHPHDPSWHNWPVLEHAIIGNIVPDFPLINKSFNLSYSGHDL